MFFSRSASKAHRIVRGEVAGKATRANLAAKKNAAPLSRGRIHFSNLTTEAKEVLD
jgi:hypothetical protein